MKSFIRKFGILSLSLTGLFVTGVFVGRLTGPTSLPSAEPATKVAQNATTWIDTASGGLIRDLALNTAQQEKVREHLTPVATAIFSDQERSLFQMHLRLLEVHDTILKDRMLDGTQQQRLGISRKKLRDRIIQAFPQMVRENPALTLTQR